MRTQVDRYYTCTTPRYSRTEFHRRPADSGTDTSWLLPSLRAAGIVQKGDCCGRCMSWWRDTKTSRSWLAEPVAVPERPALRPAAHKEVAIDQLLRGSLHRIFTHSSTSHYKRSTQARHPNAHTIPSNPPETPPSSPSQSSHSCSCPHKPDP